MINKETKTTTSVIQNIPIFQIPESEPNQFYTMYQGKATSIITKGINSQIQADPFTGEGLVQNKNNTFTLLNYKNIKGKIGPTAKQLFLALCIHATEERISDCTVRLPLGKYMDMRGLKDKKESRRQVREDLQVLKNIGIGFREKRRGIEGNYLNINLFGGTEGIINGVIIYKFNPDFLDWLRKANVSPLPVEILKLNTRLNPNSFYFLDRISSHKIMNYYKPNADIIGVKTLLESTPLLPKHEDIKNQGRINQRIIVPFERDMDALRHTLKWHYCGHNGIQIAPPINYEQFSKALIKIDWIDYPERKKRVKITPNTYGGNGDIYGGNGDIYGGNGDIYGGNSDI